MDELLDQFLIEGRELVQQANDDLLALERDRTSAAHIDGAFRAVHTLKGSVGLFGLAPMERALHAAEDLLSAVRAGRLDAGRAVIDALLDCIGVTEVWLGIFARTGRLPSDAPAGAERLEQALHGLLRPSGERLPGPAATPDRAWLPAVLARSADALAAAWADGRPVTALRYRPSGDCFFKGEDPMALLRSMPDVIGLAIGCPTPPSLDAFDPFNCDLVLDALSTAPIEAIRKAVRFVADEVVLVEAAEVAEAADAPNLPEAAEAATRAPEDASGPEMARESAARSLRVDAARIDALVDIAGELVVAKNNLAHLVARTSGIDPHLGRALGATQADIERLVGNMHRAVMDVRMTPLAQTFRRFPRLVREIAGKLGKEVAFDIEGEDVEADKSVVDGLFEPLLHLLRNAVDHGIEPEAARTAAGKPALGRITLSASGAGDQIVIAVADDGAGIDPARIRQVAKTRNLMSGAALDALDDAAAVDLVFAPGFSTAAGVTGISGRGVGMDAVRAAAEILGGRVAMISTPGLGSTVRLTLPQAITVATIMTVRLGDELFGVPIEVVAETARVPAASIVPIRHGEAFVLRQRTVPLVHLSSLVDRPATPRSGDAKVLIVRAGQQRVGVEIDAFAERIDVMLRPLTGLLAGMAGILGGALLGDGRVLMVLDLPELIG